MNVDNIFSDAASKFDWIVEARSSPTNAQHDRVLLENEHFVALATLGSIVPGWVLVVPREKAFNLASARSRECPAFYDIRHQVRTTLASRFPGDVFEFEHGPRLPNGLLGCGVEQAHLHIVALPFDLLNEIRAVAPTARPTMVSGNSPWEAVEVDADYWLAHDPSKEESLIVYPQEPISQGVRKIIAAKVGRASAWNYHTDAFHENILETQRAFQANSFA